MSVGGLQVIEAAQVRALLDYPYLVSGLAQMHREAPPRVERLLMDRVSAQDTDNFFMIWQAWRPGAALGAKLATVFPATGTAPLDCRRCRRWSSCSTARPARRAP